MFHTVLDIFRKVKLTPSQILVLGFLFFITIGSIFLSLPIAGASGKSIGFMDAFFTSTSAVCVTGLVVRDLSTEFSLFGQIVVLILIQLGGLGYMTSATLITIAMGKKMGIRDRILMQRSMNLLSMEGVIGFVKKLVIITLIVEFVGALILTARFALNFGLVKGFYLGLFHSVSAFNNAGFSLFSNSLSDYTTDIVVNLVICVAVLLGGIGFFVFSDISDYLKKRVLVLTIHTKVAVLFSLFLLLFFTVAIFLMELNNSDISGSFLELGFLSFFHSVSSRTAGFNTVDITLFSDATLFLMILFMFVGASPGSTGGGIKTTTFAIILLAIWHSIRGKSDVRVFRRTVPKEMIIKAFFLSCFALIMICTFTIMLLAIEDKEFFAILFEVVSAFGTVGLSLGDGLNHSLSATFSSSGKLLVVLAMFMGRVGPITFFTAVVQGKRESRYKLPRGKIMIG